MIIGITQIEAQNIIVMSLRPLNNNSRHTYIYPENVSNNKYFIKEISTQGVLKKIGNKLLHKAIRSKDYNKLNMYLKTKIYYRFFAIRYTNVI